MRFEYCSKLQALAIFIFLIAGCNSEDPSNNPDTADTTANNQSTRYTPSDASKRVTKTSTDVYRQLTDTLNVRVVVGTYKPCDSSITHVHPAFELYARYMY
jgi:hypothetical protein